MRWPGARIRRGCFRRVATPSSASGTPPTPPKHVPITIAGNQSVSADAARAVDRGPRRLGQRRGLYRRPRFAPHVAPLSRSMAAGLLVSASSDATVKLWQCDASVLATPAAPMQFTPSITRCEVCAASPLPSTIICFAAHRLREGSGVCSAGADAEQRRAGRQAGGVGPVVVHSRRQLARRTRLQHTELQAPARLHWRIVMRDRDKLDSLYSVATNPRGTLVATGSTDKAVMPCRRAG